MSVESNVSGFSAMRLGRSGLGNKMFEVEELGAQLMSILASPLESVVAGGGGDGGGCWRERVYRCFLDLAQRPDLGLALAPPPVLAQILLLFAIEQLSIQS